jgi:hypothetical protein
MCPAPPPPFPVITAIIQAHSRPLFCLDDLLAGLPTFRTLWVLGFFGEMWGSGRSSTGYWGQGLMFARQVFSHYGNRPSPFAFSLFVR